MYSGFISGFDSRGVKQPTVNFKGGHEIRTNTAFMLTYWHILIIQQLQIKGGGARHFLVATNNAQVPHAHEAQGWRF